MARKSYRVKFAGGSGFDLAGIIDRPDDLQAMPVVVFSHCFTCNKDLKAIVRLSRALSEHGIGVLRYDMTGLGGSGGRFADTSFSTNLADLDAAIRFATDELGPVSTLVGHSFGGAAALAAAGSGQWGGIRAVVTLAAPSDTQHLAKLLSRMDPEIEQTGSGSVKIGGRSWEIRQEMLDDFRKHDVPRLVSQIEAPTLLMHSPADQTVGFDHALRIMGLIQSCPDRSTPVSLLSLDGADHLLSESTADLSFVGSTAAAFIQRYASPE